MKFINRLRYLLILVIDWLVKIGFSKREKSGVALIRLDSIGDFVIWLDSAKEYRNIYPNQRITLIANSQWAALAEQFSYWDEVWPLAVNKFTASISYRLSILRRINAASFAVAVNAPFSRVLLLGDSVIRSTQATTRIGSIGDSSNQIHKKISDRWYSKLLPVASVPMMELRRNAEFVSNLQGATHAEHMPHIPVLSKDSFASRMDVAYFIVFPGASWVGRQWPVAKFSAVLSDISRKYGWLPVLCGSTADTDLCMTIEASVSVACINMAGKTDLMELTEAIRGARVLISNETSAVHFAAAVGTPSVCILGGGHYGRFMPYPEDLLGVKPVVAVEPMPCFHCNWLCTKKYDAQGAVPCIDAISVEQVLGATEAALEHWHRSNHREVHVKTPHESSNGN